MPATVGVAASKTISFPCGGVNETVSVPSETRLESFSIGQVSRKGSFLAYQQRRKLDKQLRFAGSPGNADRLRFLFLLMMVMITPRC
jgi:hypothetical protein